MDRGVVRRRGRGAGLARGRRARGVEIIQPAVNPTGRPEKDNTNKKKENKIRKEIEYSLGCWSLWWKRMEREGVKEMMAGE